MTIDSLSGGSLTLALLELSSSITDNSFLGLLLAGNEEDGKLAEASKEIKALRHVYRDTKIICDLPLTYHLPKLILW